MSPSIQDGESNASRAVSPLCSQDFKTPPSGLRPVIPPRWMGQGLAAVIVATILSTAWVLFSPMDEYINAPGEVRPADFSYVYSRSDGLLDSVLVVDGEHVEQKQVLARLDPWEISKTIEQIQGQIEQAKAELELASSTARKVIAAPVPPEFLFSSLEVESQKEVQDIQQNYLRRLNDLQKSGAASGTEVLNVRLQLIASETLLKRSQQASQLFTGSYGNAARDEAGNKQKVAAAHLDSLEKSLASAYEDLKRLEIIASESGMILATASRFPGEKVRAGEPLFKITSTSSTELRLYATEDRVNRIRAGQLVRFRANNNPDRLAPLATGRVTEVALDRELDPAEDKTAARSPYRIKVAVEKTPYPLAIGAIVQAEIIIDRRPFWRLLFLKASAKN